MFILYPVSAWSEFAVFDYEDFGPQVIAYETIGYQWYQWNSSGDSNPNKTDNIKVVVYWNESLENIKQKFPVNPETEKDYRYLSYEAALKYLNSKVTESPELKNIVSTRDLLEKLRNN